MVGPDVAPLYKGQMTACRHAMGVVLVLQHLWMMRWRTEATAVPPHLMSGAVMSSAPGEVFLRALIAASTSARVGGGSGGGC